MHTLTWILASALTMSAIAWIGLLAAALREAQLKALLLPLVAFAAGSLLGGALLHLLPEAVAASGPGPGTFLPAVGGFALFFLMEQFLSWHHAHSVEADVKQPVTYLILLADGLHNFIGGLAIGASFMVSTEVGVITWIAAAAHEVPQELGDFGILIRGGWRTVPALVANFVSAATIVPGALLAYYLFDRRLTMHAIFAATVLVVTLPITSAAPALPQGPGSGGQTPRYDTSTEVTLRGTIEIVKQVEDVMGKRSTKGTHIIVKTAQETVEVHLGPTTFINEQKLTLSAGDAVEIIGSRVKVSGADAVIAREIRKGTQTVTLRDDKGVPKWSRGRGR